MWDAENCRRFALAVPAPHIPSFDTKVNSLSIKRNGADAVTKRMLWVTALCCAISAVASGLDWEDYTLGALRFLLDRSDLIVVATIMNEPTRHTTEPGPFQYNCKIAIKRVMKGDNSLEGKQIEVGFVRGERSAEDRHPLITKNAGCMLFLKRELGEGFVKWISADLWLGVQPVNSVMADALAELAEQEDKKPVERVGGANSGSAGAPPE